MTYENWMPVLIVTPLFLSWITTYVTGSPEKSRYKKAWFQPPGWIFGVVWTYLYLVLGAVVYESVVQSDYFTFGLTLGVLFLTYTWQFTFSKYRMEKLSIFIIFLTLTLSLILFARLIFSEVVKNSDFGEGYLYIYAPLITWLIFAQLLSSHSRFRTFKQ